jgi:hypothetical protein
MVVNRRAGVVNIAVIQISPARGAVEIYYKERQLLVPRSLRSLGMTEEKIQPRIANRFHNSTEKYRK